MLRGAMPGIEGRPSVPPPSSASSPVADKKQFISVYLRLHFQELALYFI
jgi:hypothetical protein